MRPVIEARPAPRDRTGLTRRQWLAFAGGAALVSVSGCANAGRRAHEWQSPYGRDHALIGRYFIPAEARFIEPAEVIDRLGAARYTLLGETHDNPDHHELHAHTIGSLIATGRRPAIVFEMIAAGQADALKRHLETRPRDAAGLGSAIDWERSGWPAWSLYQPIAEIALKADLPIAAGNLDPQIVRALASGRSPDRALYDRLGLDKPLPPAFAASLEHEISEAHCGYVEGDALKAMALGQRARDTTMARRLVDAATTDGAVLIAGNGHCRKDRGVPYYLRGIDPGASSMSLAFIEVTSGKEAPGDYAEGFDSAVLPFDMVHFTARIDARDACERFKEQLEKMKSNGAASGT